MATAEPNNYQQNFATEHRKRLVRSVTPELRVPGLTYLPSVEDTDNDILEPLDRRKRVLVFRPLFVYRQQQINKIRQPSKRVDKKKPTRTTKRPPTTTTTTEQPPAATTTNPSYAQYHPDYAGSYYYHSSHNRPYYTQTETPYYRPQPYRPIYDNAPHAILAYPRPEYPASYPTYVWSNYIDNPNRRSAM